MEVPVRDPWRQRVLRRHVTVQNGIGWWDRDSSRLPVRMKQGFGQSIFRGRHQLMRTNTAGLVAGEGLHNRLRRLRATATARRVTP